MKLIVGLGNYGIQYNNTRHNVGFKIVDEFLKSKNLNFDKKVFNGIYTIIKQGNQTFIVAKPYTYMNRSGEFVKLIMNYFNIATKDLLVVYDDINFLVGEVKLKNEGSSGGQKGIQNIIDLLKTTKIKRIKIGIGIENRKQSLHSFVLSKFRKEDLPILEKIYPKINKSIELFLEDKFLIAQNEFNNQRIK